MVVLFILWTVAISLIDVQPIGPQNSSVGFATLNGFIHSLTGVHMAIYTVTDWSRTDTALLYFGICVAWTYTAY